VVQKIALDSVGDLCGKGTDKLWSSINTVAHFTVLCNFLYMVNDREREGNGVRTRPSSLVTLLLQTCS
jgi:hypothetical protein